MEEEKPQDQKEKLKKILEIAKWEDEMIFDHGPLIIGSRDKAPKDRFSQDSDEDKD